MWESSDYLVVIEWQQVYFEPYLVKFSAIDEKSHEGPKQVSDKL